MSHGIKYKNIRSYYHNIIGLIEITIYYNNSIIFIEKILRTYHNFIM